MGEEVSSPDLPEPATSGWFIARVQHRKEGFAAEHLERQGFVVFLPRLKKARRHARRIDSVLVPLFPGYLFVTLHLDRPGWRSVNGTFGVVGLLGDAHGPPSPVPPTVMTDLIERCPQGLFNPVSEPLHVGEAVRITHGPFADFTAKVSKLDTRGRVQLLLDALGGGLLHCAPDTLERV